MSNNKIIEDPSHYTILFVDDEKNILSSLNRLFRSEGYNILLAESGAEGLKVLEKANIDVIISDMRMPNMNGAEFLQQAYEKFPATERILLTGYSEIESTIDAINKGKIFKYISKPWEENDIKLTVRSALETKILKKQRDELLELTKNQNKELKEFNELLEVKVKQRTAEIEQANEMLDTAHDSLKDSYKDTIQLLSNIIEIKEYSSKGCSIDIKNHCYNIALKMNMDELNCAEISDASLLRDIGKICLPDHLLNTYSGELKESDLNKVQNYPLIGHAILMEIGSLKTPAKYIRHCLEQYNGKGFPDGLAGDEIPLGSRIIAVVNDFYALQYSHFLTEIKLSEYDAIEYIDNNKGEIYDPEIVNLFKRELKVIITATDEDTIKETSQPKSYKVNAAELEQGMVLEQDIVTESGAILLNKGKTLRKYTIVHLCNLERTLREVFQIYIKK